MQGVTLHPFGYINNVQIAFVGADQGPLIL